MKLLFTFLICLFSIHLLSQDISIVDINEDRGTVFISFTIKTTYQYERYKLEVYSSHNQFTTPLQYVTGPVGKEISATDQIQTIVWDAKKELKKYSGDVQLEIRGEVTYIPLYMEMEKLKVKQKKRTHIFPGTALIRMMRY